MIPNSIRVEHTDRYFTNDSEFSTYSWRLYIDIIFQGWWYHTNYLECLTRVLSLPQNNVYNLLYMEKLKSTVWLSLIIVLILTNNVHCTSFTRKVSLSWAGITWMLRCTSWLTFDIVILTFINADCCSSRNFSILFYKPYNLRKMFQKIPSVIISEFGVSKFLNFVDSSLCLLIWTFHVRLIWFPSDGYW